MPCFLKNDQVIDTIVSVRTLNTGRDQAFK